MSAFLGLSSLLGLFVTSVYFVYCIFLRREIIYPILYGFI